MAIVTLSACNTSLSQTLSSGNNSNLRDASFSSYLNSTEESFVRKLAAESSGNLIPIMSTEEKRTHVGRIKEEDEEIGVFGAEKYFKGGMDEDSPRTASMSARKYLYKNDERIDIDPKKNRIQSATPSVQSESSWNSQSALLQNGVRNPSKGNTNKALGKKILAGLGCSCSDKESVEVKEHGTGEISFNKSATSNGLEGKVTTREPRKAGLDQHLVDAVQVHKPRLEYKDKEEMHCPKTEKLGAGLNRENCFTFPSSNSGAGILPNKLQFQEQEEEQPRKSIDVFGSPVMGRRNKSLGIERRLTMLSWDATPRREEIEFSVPSRRTYNDTDSDASSDLFEIESIAGKANPFLARQTTDVASGCATPTTCYAPSEASIEWSVVTASAADFSVMSDCEELRSRTMTSPRKLDVSAIPYGKTKSNKDMQRRRSGILLGCKSQKAVNVAEDHAYRPNEKADVYPQTRHRSDSFIPVTRKSEIRSASFNSKPGQHAFATQSPRIPHLLYIQ
ncbi:protein PHYTOCHROME KINASE SUBSTRATE 1-like [Juglans microcarpa x Juglans regia]|uniref:protein PHYTOCHROME KINASE SUBSTRATE 1-like n=1 Tax=Juglans microcarpa x Juglans regia TaxID=2249226 RepID=UPI001B7F1F6A|nr:protein PHYTOCHROME KINASE SUBSTRATE 1-like [Juglans microcarpa x Juglans regia]